MEFGLFSMNLFRRVERWAVGGGMRVILAELAEICPYEVVVDIAAVS